MLWPARRATSAGETPDSSQRETQAAPESVRDLCERRLGFLLGEDGFPSSLPDVAVLLAEQAAAADGSEDPSVLGRTELLDVVTDQADEDRGMGTSRVARRARFLRPRESYDSPESVQPEPTRAELGTTGRLGPSSPRAG